MSTAVFQPSHVDSKLHSDWLYLHADMPPAKWGTLPSFGTAATWLGMHHSLRRGQSELEHLNREFLNQHLEWGNYRQQLLAIAEPHYGHLHGHHSLEDRHYFPRLRLREPRLQAGFDLLDSDHTTIERQLHGIRALLVRLQQAGADTADFALAEQLHHAVAENGQWLYRHLMDEEDLVIPMLALYDAH
ncbi:iron-sulfur cluster repair protein YtfE (RIC family) [Neisseria sp. HSC-16F19]|nr:hemerythrin domain-containing protein [Neisseria sp. HSC-16F19]MCP2041557.1 iron-sulfur cluster repair protein YtfE (RIC family) [Neisseria sp. HSC-16F19]